MSSPMTSAPARADGNGLVSGAAGYVEDFCSRLEVQALDETFSLAGIELGNLTEVAGHPAGAKALFQFCEVIGDGGHGRLLLFKEVYGIDVGRTSDFKSATDFRGFSRIKIFLFLVVLIREIRG